MAFMKAVVGGLSAVAGILGSSSAKKLQKQQIALQREQLAQARQRYTDFQNQYGGIIAQQVQDAKNGVKADLDGVGSRTAANVAIANQAAQQENLRAMQRMGVNPNSGRAESLGRQTALATALATAGGVTANREAERRNAEQQTYARRQAVATQGINQLTGAQNSIDNSMANMANSYSNMADAQAREANALLTAGGQAFGKGVDSWLNNRGTGVSSGSLNIQTPSINTPISNYPTTGLSSLYGSGAVTEPLAGMTPSGTSTSLGGFNFQMPSIAAPITGYAIGGQPGVYEANTSAGQWPKLIP